MKQKFKKLWAWLRKIVLNKEMLLWVLIAELIFWSPVIVTFIFALFNPWWYTAVSAIIIFWAGPFTPAIPLQIGLAVGLKKLWEKIMKTKNRKRNEENIEEVEHERSEEEANSS